MFLFINWNEIQKNVEVYALALKDDNTIQGLVGVKNDKDSHAVYLHWACFINISSLLLKNKQRIYWRCITMNGTRPNFMEKFVINQSYYEQPNPYVNAPSCHVNLQVGKPIVLCGCRVPKQLENLPERKLFTDIYYLAVVCDDAVLTERMCKNRGVSDENWIRSSLDFNKWLKQQSDSAAPYPITLLDTSDISPTQAAEIADGWIMEKMKQRVVEG